MDNNRQEYYAKRLSRLIRCETISEFYQKDKSVFYEFHALLKRVFPNVFEKCEFEDFDGSILLRWKGESEKEPALFMNHHDVVEAPGEWKYPAFSGEIAEGKLWGRGTLDTKGGLFCMLQAAEELIEEGFVPQRDVYFESACTEETDGTGCDIITQVLRERGLHFSLSLDEGGMILHDPIGGADGDFAMVGVGEKCYADVKFIAKSHGGHASMPGKNTPLVRLGKFMAAAEKSSIFKAEVSPVLTEMLQRMAPTMSVPLKNVFGNAEAFKPLLKAVMPGFSGAAEAMLKTTIAFTMAGGSQSTNVLPQEAWVIANMRFSHHQGSKNSLDAIEKLAKKYDIEMVVQDLGMESPVSDFRSSSFKLVEEAVGATFENVITAPYIMNGASDCRYMSRVCENCLRFTPFFITDEQLESIHGLNENIDTAALVPAVDFYRYIMTNLGKI